MADPPSLRIALMVDQFPELSETFIAGEARELVALGHAVRVESAAHAPNPDFEAARGLDGRLPCRRFEGAPPAGHGLAGGPPPAARACATSGGGGAGGARSASRRCAQLAPQARRIAAFRADHLHAHFAAGAALDALRIGAPAGPALQRDAHGYDIFQLPRNLREKHERAAFAVSACDYSVAYLRDLLGAPAARPARAARDRRRRRALPPPVPYPPGPARVVAVGRLVEKKGFGRLIEAAALLRELPGSSA